MYPPIEDPTPACDAEDTDIAENIDPENVEAADDPSAVDILELSTVGYDSDIEGLKEGGDITNND